MVERATNGEVFGCFLVGPRLGTGGTATVHHARRLLTDGGEIEVGLKRLHPHLADDELSVKGFLDEARISALMDHDNICRFYEAGMVEDNYFIAMEYIEGTTLWAVLQQASSANCPPPLAVALSLTCQLCDALAHVHERVDVDSGESLDVVHRDVSPGNVMVTYGGALKLIDLGIAKSRVSEGKTKTGIIKGKFGYMAPEVLAGAPARPSADIYAVGIVAWELLTAERLFSGKDDFEVFTRAQAREIDPPSSRTPICPPQLDEIVMRALAERPDQRFPSIATMGAAIRAVATELHEPISPAVVATWLGSEAVPTPAPDGDSAATTAPHIEIEIEFEPTTVDRPPLIARETLTTRACPAPSFPLAVPAPAVFAAPYHPGSRAKRTVTILAGALLASTLLLVLLSLRETPPVISPVDEIIDNTVADPSPRLPPPPAETDPAAPAAKPPTSAGQDRMTQAPTPPTTAVTEPRPTRPEDLCLSLECTPPKRIAGRLPRSRSSRASYRAQLCIDSRGKVTSVDVVAGPKHLRRRIRRNLRRWRYAPFLRDGKPTAICFSVTSRLREW